MREGSHDGGWSRGEHEGSTLAMDITIRKKCRQIVIGSVVRHLEALV